MVRRWDISGSCAIELEHDGHVKGFDHAVEKSAYDKAINALKRISRTRTRNPVAIQYRKIARETLKELEG